MNTAAMVAKSKREHPDQFCPRARCLWRIKAWDGSPRTPCGKHPLPGVALYAIQSRITGGPWKMAGSSMDLGTASQAMRSIANHVGAVRVVRNDGVRMFAIVADGGSAQ
jgi:hypothetical protein